MARTKLTSRKTTGGKAKQFASKASGKSANVNSIVKKAALSPSLKTLISVEKLTHKQVFNALKDNNEIDANLQETIYEGKVQILREGHKNWIHFILTLIACMYICLQELRIISFSVVNMTEKSQLKTVRKLL